MAEFKVPCATVVDCDSETGGRAAGLDEVKRGMAEPVTGNLTINSSERRKHVSFGDTTYGARQTLKVDLGINLARRLQKPHIHVLCGQTPS